MATDQAAPAHRAGTPGSDRVDYTLPLRGLGVARFVAGDLRGIFTYRQRALADLFD